MSKGIGPVSQLQDAVQVSLVGHSAGAHLVMMALLGRAKAARAQRDGKVRGLADTRLPSQLIGTCNHEPLHLYLVTFP